VDRELVLAGLTLTSVGVTLLTAGFWSRRITPPASAQQWERTLWRALWRPVIPAVLMVSVLLGWAVMEPAQSDEHLPSSVLIVSGLFTGLWLRAAIRAAVALKDRTPHVAGTVGLWRARMVLSDVLTTRLDPDALDAVVSHEAAHVRHRDPLRIWLAQLVTDLQWPWPAAQDRFARWRHVLELARDEEARLSGTDGADLAAAVLLAARLHTFCSPGATLIDGRIGLEARIARLLAPLPSDDGPIAMTSPLTLFPVSLVGVLSGVRFGEGLVQTLVKWLP
jgi:hypothetical protein